MKNVIVLFSIIILLQSSACNQNSSKNVINYEDISVQIEDNYTKISSLFSSADFIKLDAETNDQLIKNIDAMKVEDEHIFIKSNQAIFIFNVSGKFVNKISKRGKAPGEYSRMTDFYIDPKLKYIEINDFDQKKIIRYDMFGNFISEWKHNLIVQKFTKINEIYLFYCSSFINDISNRRLLFIKENDKKPFNEYFKISKNEAWYLYIEDYTNFSVFNNNNSFLFSQNDTVYSIIENTIKPRYVVNFLGNNIPNKYYDKNYDNIFLFIQDLNKSNYMGLIDNFYESDLYITFTFRNKGLLYQTFYNKKTKECSVTKKLVDDINFDNHKFEIDFSFRPLEVNENNMYFAIDPSNLISAIDSLKKYDNNAYQNFKNNHNSLFNLYNNTKITDNPIIYKLRFK